MPKELQDELDASSSVTAATDQPGSQPDQVKDGTPASSADDDKAASSADEQGKAPSSPLEAAKAAIAADDAKKVNSDPIEEGKDTSAKPAGESEDGKEPTDEELEQGIDKLSDGAQKRIKTLSRRLKDANARADAAEADFKPDAERFAQLSQFTQRNGLSGEEVQQGLQIMALMKNNPIEALKVLQPHLDGLNSYVGNKLPVDLQGQVDAGELTERHAKEIVLTRNEALRNAQLVERGRETRTQEETRSQQAQVATDMTNALNGYEQELRAATPDYDRMKPFYYDKVKAALLSDRPKSVAEVREVAKAAWTQTQAAFKGLGIAPKPPIVPVRGDGKRPTPSDTAPPKTALEAARRAVGDA